MTSGPTEWIIYACRTSYAGDVAEIIWRTGGDIRFMVDNLEGTDTFTSDIARVVRPDVIGLADHGTPTVIPQVTPGHRYVIQEEARAAGLGPFLPLTDPSAVVARRGSMGEGVVINAGSAIGANYRLGRFVHINRSASIGHDADLGDFVSVGPGAVLAGHVTVGTGAFLGTGSVCAPKVTIGENSVIGAGAVVIGDVPPGAVVVGNPARVIRQGDVGFGGVSVPVP